MIFMHKGESLLSFQHIRKAEWPPEGGASTVCSSLPPSFHPEWMAQSVALLRHIGRQGAAMVEYRYDKQTDTRALMEINGRFWGSLPLAYHAGARFAWLTYSVLGLHEIPEIAEYRAGMTCRYMTPETRRVLTVVFNPGYIKDRTLRISKASVVIDYILGFFRPSVRYFIFSFHDPMPFVMDMTASISKGFGIVVTNVCRVAGAGLFNYLRRIVMGSGKSARL
jgi:predicted ATP-grasp superfamily ATP-dependent carboligase